VSALVHCGVASPLPTCACCRPSLCQLGCHARSSTMKPRAACPTVPRVLPWHCHSSPSSPPAATGQTARVLPPRDRALAAHPHCTMPAHARSCCPAWPSASHHPVPSHPLPVSCLQKNPHALHSVHTIDFLSARVRLSSLPLFSS
jgi:hypothetical protein